MNLNHQLIKQMIIFYIFTFQFYKMIRYKTDTYLQNDIKPIKQLDDDFLQC